MIRQAILATALVASMSTFAAAQDAPPPPSHGAATEGPGAHRGMEDHRDRWKEGAEKHRGPGPGGKHHSKGPDRGKPLAKGIEIKMGSGEASVRIECGVEPMAECLAAAKPILDGLDRNGHGGHGKHERRGAGEAPQPN